MEENMYDMYDDLYDDTYGPPMGYPPMGHPSMGHPPLGAVHVPQDLNRGQLAALATELQRNPDLQDWAEEKGSPGLEDLWDLLIEDCNSKAMGLRCMEVAEVAVVMEVAEENVEEDLEENMEEDMDDYREEHLGERLEVTMGPVNQPEEVVEPTLVVVNGLHKGYPGGTMGQVEWVQVETPAIAIRIHLQKTRTRALT
ncbi:MAG: hypothetical protein Q9196_001616 [Gyalolechia fulgens]